MGITYRLLAYNNSASYVRPSIQHNTKQLTSRGPVIEIYKTCIFASAKQVDALVLSYRTLYINLNNYIMFVFS